MLQAVCTNFVKSGNYQPIDFCVGPSMHCPARICYFLVFLFFMVQLLGLVVDQYSCLILPIWA